MYRDARRFRCFRALLEERYLRYVQHRVAGSALWSPQELPPSSPAVESQCGPEHRLLWPRPGTGLHCAVLPHGSAFQSVACGFLVELCVKQSERNIGDRKGACDEKKPPRPAKEHAASHCELLLLQLRDHGRTPLLPLSGALKARSTRLGCGLTSVHGRARSPSPRWLGISHPAMQSQGHRSECTDCGYRERFLRRLTVISLDDGGKECLPACLLRKPLQHSRGFDRRPVHRRCRSRR